MMKQKAMAPRSRGRISVATAVVIVLGACGSKNSGSDEPKPEIPPATVFKVSAFSNPTQIDNRFYPMEPGTRWTFEGSADRGTGREPHQVIITVTDLVKDIHGVTNVVVWEEDLDEGILAESELAFFAQDDSGNLWNFGEYPELWEKKKFKGAPSTWISGLSGAQGGIHVPGMPKEGSPSYREGTAPKIDFLDGARVEGLNRQACALIGCVPNVLVIDEWNTTPGDGHQLKNYAPGIGMFRVDPRGGDEEESLLLMKHEMLTVKEMAEVRRETLNLDRRGYEHGGKDYPKTTKARPRP